MKEIKRIIEDVKNYCDFYLEFDKTNVLYKFNDMYIDEIDFDMFENKIKIFKEDLVSILKAAGKPLPLLKDLLKELRIIIVPYKNEGVDNYSNFDKFSRLIVTTQNNPIKKIDRRYSVEELNKFNTEYDENNEELYYYLISKRNDEIKFENQAEIEKIKLHYTITKFYESIYLFENFLEELKVNIEKYSFFQFDDALPSEYRHRCTVNYSKMETAHLFNALFESGILFFPDYDGDHFKTKRNSFIDENFNYVDKREYNKIEKIAKISKEFTYINSRRQEERQREILEKLINSLIEIKAKI